MIIQLFAKIKCVNEIMALADSITEEDFRKQLAVTCISVHSDPNSPNGINDQVYAVGIHYLSRIQSEKVEENELVEKRNSQFMEFHKKLTELLTKYPEPTPPKVARENIRRPGGYDGPGGGAGTFPTPVK